MRLEMFAVHDSKAEAFLTPFFQQKVNMAIRIFAECANSKDHHFAKHPGDYTLYHLGTFDDQNAIVDLLAPPRNLGLAAQFVNPKLENLKELRHAS